MRKAKVRDVEVGAVIPLSEVIAATGIQLMIWAELIDKTDPNESYEPFSKMQDEMLTHSEVLAEIAKQYPKLSRSMKIHLPADVGVIRVKNPLFKLDAAGASSDDEAPDDSVEESLPF